MANCLFCDVFVGEDNGDGGVKGRTIGNRDICEQCLGELKYWLEKIEPKSPSTRKSQGEELQENNFHEETNAVGDDEPDPLTSKAKI